MPENPGIFGLFGVSLVGPPEPKVVGSSPTGNIQKPPYCTGVFAFLASARKSLIFTGHTGATLVAECVGLGKVAAVTGWTWRY